MLYFSRIVQLGYIVLDSKNNEIKEYCSIVFPKEFKIENDHIHGITHNKAIKEGKPLINVIETFFRDVKECDTLIAHNIKFDFNVLLSELHRLKLNDFIQEFLNKKLYCTMIESKKKYNMIKYPKLVQLFSFLHKGKTWNQIHDALDDCKCCMKCYVLMN